LTGYFSDSTKPGLDTITHISGRLSQELGFHPQLANFALKFLQACPLRQIQRWFIADMLSPVFIDPRAQGSLVNAQLLRHLDDRAGSLDHQPRRFSLELRAVFPTFLLHSSSSILGGTLLGPLSGIWEARQTSILERKLQG
jgi:hypothetical protein